MKKRVTAFLVVLLMFTTLLAGCSNDEDSDGADMTESPYPAEFQAFLDVLDLDFSTEVNETISQMGDDPELGFRSAGSLAEFETAEYLEGLMKEIGLQNVTIDPITVDGWTFKGANLTLADDSGEDTVITLGGYQTTLQVQDEPVKVVYLGKGTASDYKDVDVNGKLVLLDIDQNEEWWINLPAYQAHIKGALAVLANSAMPVEMDDRIGTQDICGPDYAPAFGISQQDTNLLLNAMEASRDGEIEVLFNADSLVTPNTESSNVWGEIPGKTDEVIYMMAHRDGYFHSYFDDASGLGLCMGVAKGIIDSGYQPDKTIRFVFHGSEEWGRINSQADWAIGAFEQITNVHPEWAEDAFAIVNIDGAYCVEGETTFGIAVCEELINYIDPLVKPMTDESPYTYRYMMPPSTYKEDFCYVAMGVPSVSTAKGEETIFYDTGYHTSADSREAMGFDEDAWLWMHTLYARIVYGFDSLAVRPMDFTPRLGTLKASYDKTVINDEELMEKIDQAIEAAGPVAEKVNKLNEEYVLALENENLKEAEDIRQEAIAFNRELHEAYKIVQEALLHLDQEMSIIFPHENRQSNILNLMDAIDTLRDGKGEEACEEYLSAVGNGWNAMFFDKETVDFFNDSMKTTLANTWADGLVDVPDCYVDDVVRSLMSKIEAADTDYEAEIRELQALEREQNLYLNDVIEDEKEGLDKIIAVLEGLI